MTDTIIEERAAIPKTGEWAERIAAQQRGGNSVKQFCKEQGLTEGSFYAWRKRLRKREPVRFALVDRPTTRQEPATESALELLLATGERLRIGAGVDARDRERLPREALPQSHHTGVHPAAGACHRLAMGRPGGGPVPEWHAWAWAAAGSG